MSSPLANIFVLAREALRLIEANSIGLILLVGSGKRLDIDYSASNTKSPGKEEPRALVGWVAGSQPALCYLFFTISPTDALPGRRTRRLYPIMVSISRARGVLGHYGASCR